MVGSLLVMGTSFVLRPFMSELWHWYVLSFLQLVPFSGMTILPAGRLIGLWFRRTRGRMMGITNAGANFGGLVVPPATALVLAVGTWRDAYLALGLTCFGVALYSLLVVRERPLRAPAPEDGAGSAPEPAAGGEAGDGEEVHWTTRRALRTRSFYAIAVAVCLGCFTYATILPHVVVHLTNEGASIAFASVALGMLAASGIAGKICFGFVAERLGARRAFIVDLLGHAAAVLCLAFAPSPLLMLAVTPVYGLFMGGTGVLLLLIVQETFGVRHYGAILGLINMSTIITFRRRPPARRRFLRPHRQLLRRLRVGLGALPVRGGAAALHQRRHGNAAAPDLIPDPGPAGPGIAEAQLSRNRARPRRPAHCRSIRTRTRASFGPEDRSSTSPCP